MNQLFPTYAAEVGFSPMVGGFMVSAASLFDLFLNPIVGTTCDKFGSTKAILSWLAVSILSFVMLMMSSGNSTLSILAAGVNDVMYVIAGTALTVLVMDVFGSRDFGRIFALICSVGLYRRRLWHARHDEGIRALSAPSRAFSSSVLHATSSSVCSCCWQRRLVRASLGTNSSIRLSHTL